MVGGEGVGLFGVLQNPSECFRPADRGPSLRELEFRPAVRVVDDQVSVAQLSTRSASRLEPGGAGRSMHSLIGTTRHRPSETLAASELSRRPCNRDCNQMTDSLQRSCGSTKSLKETCICAATLTGWPFFFPGSKIHCETASTAFSSRPIPTLRITRML